MAIMPEQMAQHTVEKYRCSRCWGFLVKTWATDETGQLKKTEDGEQLAKVQCRGCDEDLGFVTASFIEKVRTKDFDFGYEVKRDLFKMGIITKENAHAY